jgi:hypothetical protein
MQETIQLDIQQLLRASIDSFVSQDYFNSRYGLFGQPGKLYWNQGPYTYLLAIPSQIRDSNTKCTFKLCLF